MAFVSWLSIFFIIISSIFMSFFFKFQQRLFGCSILDNFKVLFFFILVYSCSLEFQHLKISWVILKILFHFLKKFLDTEVILLKSLETFSLAIYLFRESMQAHE